jgi:hypothetical protein
MASRKTPKATRVDDRKRDRLALTPPPALRAALEDLAEAMEKPPATIAVELLVEMIPQLQGLAKIARYAKAGKKEAAKRALQHMVGDSFAEVLTSAQPDLYGKPKP